MPFYTSYFTPLSFDDVMVFLKTKNGSVEEKKKFYQLWLYGFYRQATMFYQCQYVAHQRIVERYMESLGVDQEDYRYNEIWDESGLSAHSEQMNKQQKRIKRIVSDAAPELYERRSDIRSLAEVFQEYLFEIELGLTIGARIDDLDEYWFNLTINNSNAEQTALRRMPYRDYLQTAHWKRVRAAMLMINSATCECARCGGLESWWSTESDLHVHHKSYKNRGNERYADLELVCYYEHERRHFKENQPAQIPEFNDAPF